MVPKGPLLSKGRTMVQEPSFGSPMEHSLFRSRLGVILTQPCGSSAKIFPTTRP